jgi:hypothetical protein
MIKLISHLKIFFSGHRIHQSMDMTPFVNVINVDPFANHPLSLNNQTSAPGMEFTCGTANFIGPIPVTN